TLCEWHSKGVYCLLSRLRRCDRLQGRFFFELLEDLLIRITLHLNESERFLFDWKHPNGWCSGPMCALIRRPLRIRIRRRGPIFDLFNSSGGPWSGPTYTLVNGPTLMRGGEPTSTVFRR